MIRTVHFISGGGSTSAKVWEAQQQGGRLRGLVETVAVVSDHPEKGGLQVLIDNGFPEKDTHCIDSSQALAPQMLRILDEYRPDYFHQMGWMPKTPVEVIRNYQGLNQHYGPGGKSMFGVRRAWVHKRFCEETGQPRLPIPVFCQIVHPELDKGDMVYFRYEPWWKLGETAEEIAAALLPAEHAVQIEGLLRLATKKAVFNPVARVAKTPEQFALLEKLAKEARDLYPNH